MTLLLAVLALALLRDRPAELGLAPWQPWDPRRRRSWPRADPRRPAPLVERLPIAPSSVRGLHHLRGLRLLLHHLRDLLHQVPDRRARLHPGRGGRAVHDLGWLSLACGLLWGWVSDHIGRKAALVIVYLIHTPRLRPLRALAGAPGLLLSAVLFVSPAWSIPTYGRALRRLLGPRLAPAGLDFITLFFGIGQALAPSAAGLIADAAGSLAPAMLLAAVALSARRSARCCSARRRTA